ncbi:alpha/beta fold hydrolase [Nocardia sp. NPDC055029]
MTAYSEYEAASGIAYTRIGEGEPLLLIHGIGSNRHAWDSVLAEISRHREVVAVDLPGFGQSRLSETAASVEGYADALTALCTELGLELPHVAGHSLGGAIALELGRRGRARSVTAIAPLGFWRAAGALWCQATLRNAHALSRIIRPLVPVLVRTSLGRAAAGGLFYGKPTKVAPEQLVADTHAFLDGEAFSRVCDSFGDYVFSDVGRLDDIPVTIVWGRRDLLVPARWQARRARTMLRRARHIQMGGAGHVVMTDDPVSTRLLLTDRWG